MALIPDKAMVPPVTEIAPALALLKAGCVTEALFELAAEPAECVMPPSFDFWREFACAYLFERCQSSALSAENALIELTPMQSTVAQRIIDSAPPMSGAEYLSVALLQEKWRELDHWLLAEVDLFYKDLDDLLEQRAPRWHASGQVYFHLAENKNDTDRPFAFMATWLPKEGVGAGRHQPLTKALSLYSGSESKQKLIDLLKPIDQAAQSSEFVASLVDNKLIYSPQAWQPIQAYQFLREVPFLQQSGVVVRLPDWWEKRSKPQVQAVLSTPASKVLDAGQLLKFNVSAVLDGETLSEEEWQQLMLADSGLMLLKGRWVEVNSEQLSEAMQQMTALRDAADADGLSFFEGMRLLAGAGAQLGRKSELPEVDDWRFVKADAEFSKLIDRICHPEVLRTALPGRMLKAKLRPYQQIGVRWLWQLNQLGLGACLADDMGLGKTIQVISLLLLLKKKKVSLPSLLVLPTSLLGNWQVELEKFSPSLNCCFIHSSLNSKTSLARYAKEGLPEDVDLVLTTYGTLPRQSWISQHSWHTVVLDEAQAIKNASSRQSKVVKSLKSINRIALTGTPVENRLSDLWSLFDFINPGLLGNFAEFKRFAKMLEERETEKYAPLRKLVQPYILRRLKTDKRVISDLPDKTEVLAWCGLSKRQATLYQQSVKELAKALETFDGMKRRGLVLAYILRFKQICNHPSQYLSSDAYLLRDSGKFLRLIEICEQIAARQEKVLVFTQFRGMCEPLAEVLAELFARPGLILHGGTSAKKRQQHVLDFQAEGGPPFFVLSIKAGGTGLNLTAASHVIHFDRWWNPAVENQATDRAFRIGQKRNVMVHKFVCRGTIEEKIDKIISDKSNMVDGLLEGGGEPLLTEMNNEELLALVKLDLQHAQDETQG